MKICVVGTGYVGLVTGACFAELGHSVTCIDIDEKKVERMRAGVCPIYEPGLEEIMQSNIADRRLNFETDFSSVKSAEAIFLAIGTPSMENGDSDLSFVFSACDSIADFLQNGAIVVIKSTVPVGTSVKIRGHLASRTKATFSMVNNPEFLKEGTAVSDFMEPERIIIGYHDESAGARIEELYAPFNKEKRRTITMSNLSAEMTKYAANCFLAAKISLMNEFARMCDVVGADVEEVKRGIASDSRIGAQFLNPGPGYGGSCLPKDVKAMSAIARLRGTNFRLMDAVDAVNQEHKLYLFQKIRDSYSDLSHLTFALWGVAFKANTDDIRETPAIEMVEALHRAGAKVRIFDPAAAANFQSFMKPRGIELTVAGDQYEALTGADALIVLTEWRQFKEANLEFVRQRLREAQIFDGRNLWDPDQMRTKGFRYHCIGRPRIQFV